VVEEEGRVERKKHRKKELKENQEDNEKRGGTPVS